MEKFVFFLILPLSFGFENSLHSHVYWYDGHYYKYYNNGVGLNYEDARDRCLSDSGYLVVFNSEGESEHIRNVLRDIDKIYPNDRTGMVLIGMHWDDSNTCYTPTQNGDCDWSIQWLHEGLTSQGWDGWLAEATFETSVLAPSPPDTAVVLHTKHNKIWRTITTRVKLPFLCEFDTACVDAINPCGSGVCLTENGVDFTCQCDTRYYTGLRCETELNACDSNPCVRGTCMPKPRYDYECDCPGIGYEGKRCDRDIDECLQDDACNYYGQCVNTEGSFSCTCEAGREGVTCLAEVGKLKASCASENIALRVGLFFVGLVPGVGAAIYLYVK